MTAKRATTTTPSENIIISTTSTANAVPISDQYGKLDPGWLPGGSGSNIDADLLDGYHAGTTPSVNTIPVPTTTAYLSPWIQTQAAMTIYVDADNGNDTTGDGSSSAPYKTVSKALSVIPRVLNHDVTIICKKATNSYGTLNLYGIQRSNNVALTIQGEFNTLDSGTVSSFANNTSDPEYGSLGVTCSKITDTTKNWTTNQYKNKLIRIYKGSTEHIRPITYNDATGIYFADTSVSGIDNTWSYEIVDWGTKFDYVRCYNCTSNITVSRVKIVPTTNSQTVYIVSCDYVALVNTYVASLSANTNACLYTAYFSTLIVNDSVIDMQEANANAIYYMYGKQFVYVRSSSFVNVRTRVASVPPLTRLEIGGGCRFYKGPNYNPGYAIYNDGGVRCYTTYGQNVIDCGSTAGIALVGMASLEGISNFKQGPNCAKLVIYQGANDVTNNLLGTQRLQTTAIEAGITTVTSNTTLSTSHYTVLVDASTGNKTITLPPASSCVGRIYIIKKIDSTSNTVIVDGNANETIDGQLTYDFSGLNNYVVIQSDGSGWNIISSSSLIGETLPGLYHFTNISQATLTTNGAITIGNDSSYNISLCPNAIIARNNAQPSDLLLQNQGGVVRVNAAVSANNKSPILIGSESFKVWHSGNDGSGSGLDADLLDGIHASQFARVDTIPTFSGGAGSGESPEGGEIRLLKAPNSSLSHDIVIDAYGNSIRIFSFDSNNRSVLLAANFESKTLTWNGYTVYHAGNFMPWFMVLTSTDLTVGYVYVLNISGDVTLTLPGSPSGGTIVITDPYGRCGTYTVTIARNGQPIMGLAEDMILDRAYASIGLTYIDPTIGWVLV